VLARNHTVLPATHTFIHKWNEPCLPLLPSHRASPHFGWYSFPILLRVGGWVGLFVTSFIMQHTCDVYILHGMCYGPVYLSQAEMAEWIKLVFSTEATLGLPYTVLEGSLGIFQTLNLAVFLLFRYGSSAVQFSLTIPSFTLGAYLCLRQLP